MKPNGRYCYKCSGLKNVKATSKKRFFAIIHIFDFFTSLRQAKILFSGCALCLSCKLQTILAKYDVVFQF